MIDARRWRTTTYATFALILLSGVLVSGAQTAKDCTYLNDPEEFTLDAEARYADRTTKTAKVIRYIYELSGPETTIDPGGIPRKNLIDNSIFDRMAKAGIASSPLATDGEFLRRVTLDLTGRIPSAGQVQIFLADTNPSKRDLLVDSLIGSPEFVDKWGVFFGDLFKNTSSSANVQRYTQGRDAFFLYVKDALTQNKPYDQIARELITSTGDSFAKGEPNWVVGGTVTMGPAQDTYDGQAVAVATTFLGINTVDCLLCHDGARHLDQVNLWGSKQTRMNMWGLSASFARTSMQRQAIPMMTNVAKFIVSDLAAGDYRLNTTTGNRSPRQTTNGLTLVAPKNPFVNGVLGVGSGGTAIAGENRRQALARQITSDLQFSRAIVNYIWEQFMVEAFVSPSNSFDLARLDPTRPPAGGWTLQPTNPELLNSMALWFQNNKYDLRALMGLIAKSSAYQLSSAYPGTWKVDYVPYYARKYVRRLSAEEVHDAIQKSTGVMSSYPMEYLPAVQWAMQLPEPREPARNNLNNAAAFMSSFGRGDRDQNPRRDDASTLQTMNMMNSPFVMNRIHQTNPGSRVATILRQTNDPATIIRLLFQNTLSRNPTAAETAMFVPAFQQQGLRVAAESLQWVLLNKLDFLFNY